MQEVRQPENTSKLKPLFLKNVINEDPNDDDL